MPAIAALEQPRTTNLVTLLSGAPGKNRGYVPIDLYHADRSCVSTTGLKELLRSPAHYRAYLNGECEKNTPAMLFGSAVHDMLLEPKDFLQKYVVSPFPDRRTKDAQKFEIANANKRILSQLQAGQLKGISESVSGHPLARKLLTAGCKEQTYVWQDKETGIWLKFRPDCLDLREGICLDVKKTQDASSKAFARSAVKYSYDLQAAVYLTGLREIYQRDFDFAFLAVEEAAPHGCAVYAASPEMLQHGLTRMRYALQLLKTCQEKDLWPSYQAHGGYDVLEWPRWCSI